MHALLTICGAVVVVVVFVDALSMTLHVGSGPGPLTGRVAGWVWLLLIRVHRRDSGTGILNGAGAFLIVSVVLGWVAFLWAGWAMVLLGSQGSVVVASTRAPASALEVVYFAGVTIFTLGTGDIVASSSPWRLVTAVASFTGLSLITLAITYLLSVVSAVVSRRTVAVRIHGLGQTPQDIVLGGWTGERFSTAFLQQLVSLTGQVGAMAEQHLAYPTLHYFHTGERDASAPLSIAHLDEAVLILAEGVAPGARLDHSALEPLRHAIGRYLATATATSQTSSRPSSPPPPPRLDQLRHAGIPVVTDADFRRECEGRSRRRCSLRELVRSNGWSWQGA